MTVDVDDLVVVCVERNQTCHQQPFILFGRPDSPPAPDDDLLLLFLLFVLHGPGSQLLVAHTARRKSCSHSQVDRIILRLRADRRQVILLLGAGV